MDQINYTNKEIIQIRGAFLYIIILVGVDVIASAFQFLAGIEIAVILKSFIPYLFCAFLAWLVFKRKKRREKTAVLEWTIAFLTNALIIYAKYNYASNIGWRYAAETVHMYGIAMVLLVMLQYFYNQILYLTFFAIHVINWFLFLYLAKTRGGVELPFDAIVNGQPLHTIILSRQIYLILMLAIIAYIAFRNIRDIDNFDKLATRQRKRIEDQAAKQLEMALLLKEKMKDLFEKLNIQNDEVKVFNNSLQSQAASFEEFSATIEEISTSSETIAGVSENQVNANQEMQFTINQFFEIKDQTKEKLNQSLDSMDGVVKKTNISTEILEKVEETILAIKAQSDKIRETISIIVDIAEQINLLSLNASIEAARAGDHGKGFAVVADEVGKLANLTGDSIKGIEEVLRQSEEKTTAGVDIIKQASSNIKEMINQMLASSKEIDELRDNIYIEERFLKGIEKQMEENNTLSKQTQAGTEEQKDALETTATSLDSLNEDVSRMAEGIMRISETSQKIHDDARAVLDMSEEAFGSGEKKDS